MKIHWPEYSRLLHNYLGNYISLGTAFGLVMLFEGKMKPLVVLAAFVAGILKELYDCYVKETYFDWIDVFYTTIMSVPLMILMYLMDK